MVNRASPDVNEYRVSYDIISVFLILRILTNNYTLTYRLEMLFACVVVKNFLTDECCWVYF